MKVSLLPALSLAVVLAACGGSEDAVGKGAEAPADSTETQASATEAAATANPVAFDLNAVPVSTASLEAFPHIAVPAGYEVYDDRTLDLAAFPIWTGAAFETVEGQVYMAQSKVPDGKTYSRMEFERGVENAVTALGGVRISRSEVPNQALEDLPRDLLQDARPGLGDMYGNPFSTYVIRRADQTVWVQVVAGPNSASWAVINAPSATP